MSNDAPGNVIPEELPVLSLREFVVFPYMVLPLFVARDRSIAAVDDALAGDRLILLVAQRDPSIQDPDPDDLYRVGTVAMVMRSLRMTDGRVKVLVQGLGKARIDAFIDHDSTTWVRTTPLVCDEDAPWSPESESLIRSVRTRVEELLPLKNLPPEVLSITTNVDGPGRLADLVASNLRLRMSEAQEILEIQDPLARLRRVDVLLRRELDIHAVQTELEREVREVEDRGERESQLREQLRAIQSELGDGDPRLEESDEYRQKVEEASLPPEAREEAFRQLRRMERMHPDGPEAQVVRNYLDWMVDLPWNRNSPDQLDLANARQVLDADHAHLESVKERILEFLSVRKLRHDSRGPILCFAGPPGVGKTSLGRSIAKAMGREFVRVSLGGVRDEAEIRGHRRTYVGALPGRILQGLKQAGTCNPVFMLDELDKLGNDFRGDPSSALLEVLDPEQNARFSDHFISVPFDLSSVFFIATANMLDSIPTPLRDRMEVIRLSGYTPEEKTAIARSFLIPRQVEEHGLRSDQMTWSGGAIGMLAAQYTNEAGVRNLERKVAAVCRKVARRAAEGEIERARIDRRSLVGYLGAPPFENELASREAEVGVVNGLAWTEAGGEVLQVEATLNSGDGLVLTGQLGDVMKESVKTALSYARGILHEMEGRSKAPDKALASQEIHVHVPAGAVPKDGPSAGVTMATALVSLATGIPVRGDVAMTGEITLRGKVLPVGGVREKALAALRQGVHTVLLPQQCLKDVDEIPKELRRRLEFVPVSEMREVLEIALERAPRWRRTTRRGAGTRGTASTAVARGRGRR